MASLRERLQVAREANASLRAELTALNKRTKKVEGRITRVQSLVDKAQTSAPPPKAQAPESAAEEPPAPPARTTKPAEKKAVVFDFDKCLMKEHWWGKYRNGPLENINPQTSDFGHSDIPALLTALLALDGVTVCVASFGRHDVIKKAIRCALPEELATQVFVTTPGDFEGFQDGCSMGRQFKDTELKLICETYKLEPKDIVFFDDSKDNIEHAKKLGCAAYVVMPFADEHVVHITDHLGLSADALS